MTAITGAKASAWKTVRLGEIAEVRLGKMLDKVKHRKGRTFPYLRNINVRWGAIETDDLRKMHFEDDELERFGLRAGDVLVCEGGEPGRASVWDGRLPNLKYQKAIHRVRFSVPFEPRLLVYQLELLAKTGGLEPRFTGSTIKHFTREAIVQLPVPLPSLGEQRLIVAEIEKQFTRLEAGVAALLRVRANLKRYRAAVLKAACEGRLVPTEAELARRDGRAYETGEQLLCRLLAERRQNWTDRKNYKEPVQPEVGRLPPMPDGWTWVTADQCTSVITDGEHITPQRAESGVFLLSARNVLDGRLSFADVDFVPRHEYQRIANRLVIDPGDVLLSCSGSVGRSTVVPEGVVLTLVRSVAVLKPLSAMGKFLSLGLRSPLLQHQISEKKTQTAQANIFQGKIKALCFPLPPLAEQARIVAEVERRLSVVEELESVVSANLQRATRLRQSILSRAFSGRLISDTSPH